MSDLRAKALAFRGLHEKGKTLVLPNAWDGASALILEDAGFPAIGTTSAGIAFSLGLPDGGIMERGVALEAVARIASAARVPVTADLEGGYCESPEGLVDTIAEVIGAGVVGCNLEDGSGDPDTPLIAQAAMVEKIAAAREASAGLLPEFFINARTDGFWAGGSGPEVLEEAIERGRAYLAAGADCVFVPLVSDRDSIKTLASAFDAPLNLLITATLPPLSELKELSVRRVSTGGALARSVLGHLQRLAATLNSDSDFGFTKDAISHADLQSRLSSRTRKE